jgi:glycosyltransferase 2 family protein
MRVRKALGTALTLLLTGVLLGWFLQKADLRRVLSDASEASVPYLALAVAGEVISILLKALRLGLMLRPLRPRISFGPLLKATVVSFTLSGILPGRVGEVAKPFLLSRWLSLPFTPLLATAILERGMDLVAMVLLWVGFIAWGRAHVAPSGAEYLPYMDWITYLVLAAFVAGAAFLWWLAPRRRVFERGIPTSDRMRAHPWLAKALVAVLQFSKGLGMFQRKRDILAVVGCSLATWGILVVTSWAVVAALHIHLPFTAGILILVFVNLGAGIPTPGGIGGVHKLFYFALVTFYAVGEDQAVAAGIVGHAAMFFPGILWGLLYLAAGKVHLRELKEEIAVAKSAELVDDPAHSVD